MPAPSKGKNIILLSDGTGNSSAKLLKTNIWRLYESLDLQDPSRQVACYDDGVGSSNFKPLALVGGAVGVGLKRNVLRLYRFLCEHYDPGDRIFLFGFSRGAFTVRVLAGLILTRGIIKTRPTYATPKVPQVTSNTAGRDDDPDWDPRSPTFLPYGKELKRLAAWEYRAYRRAKYSQFNLSFFVRPLRDGILGGWQALRNRRPYRPPTDGQPPPGVLSRWRALVNGDAAPKHEPATLLPREQEQVAPPGVAVEFIGVWDTVDAYGLPIDELTDAIDRWIWPLSFKDQSLDPRVRRAAHVLALNDERQTFHPVVWNESLKTATGTTVDSRITQVWFAGMHANVGGGYPDDALSAVSFTWMVRQIENELTFVEHMLDHHRGKADVMGRIYDSRAGLKSYYRYNPRRIDVISHMGRGGDATVDIPRPKIHESVFWRIAAAPEAYAPLGIPADYAIVRNDGRIQQLNDDPRPEKFIERRTTAANRVEKQRRVWKLVRRRRLVFLANVIATALLLVLPFIGDIAERAIDAHEPDVASRSIGTILGMLPAYAAPFSAYYTAAPLVFIGGATFLVSLMLVSRWLQMTIAWKMRGIWLEALPPYDPATPGAETGGRETTDRRRQRRTRKLARAILPMLFALSIALAAAISIGLLYIAGLDPMRRFCQDASTPDAMLTTLAVGGQSQRLEFNASNPCVGTGLRLERGRRYHLQLTRLPGTPWRDATIDVPRLRGFAFTSPELSLTQAAVSFVASPLLRAWAADWFTPIAQIGITRGERVPIVGAEVTFTAERSGELFLYVNDALWPPDWDRRYRNNSGRASVVVTRDWNVD